MFQSFMIMSKKANFAYDSCFHWKKMEAYTGVIRSLENLGTGLADWFMIIWSCLSWLCGSLVYKALQQFMLLRTSPWTNFMRDFSSMHRDIRDILIKLPIALPHTLLIWLFNNKFWSNMKPSFRTLSEIPILSWLSSKTWFRSCNGCPDWVPDLKIIQSVLSAFIFNFLPVIHSRISWKISFKSRLARTGSVGSPTFCPIHIRPTSFCPKIFVQSKPNLT